MLGCYSNSLGQDSSIVKNSRSISFRLTEEGKTWRKGEIPSGSINNRSVDVILTEQARRLLTEHGYFSGEIQNIRSAGAAKYRIEIDRGPAYTIDTLIIRSDSGKKALNHSYNRLIKPGDRYRKQRVEREIDEILSAYEKSGFALAEVVVSGIDMVPEQQQVRIVLTVDSGPLMRLSGSLFPNLKHIGKEYAETVVNIPDSSIITPERLKRARQNLDNTDLFREVRDPQIVVRDSAYYVQFPLEERNPNEIDLLVGYVPAGEEGGTFIGDGELTFRNALWDGSITNLRFERMQQLVTNLEIQYQRNWLLGAPFGMGGVFTFYQQDSTYQIRNLILNGDYTFGGSTTISGSIRREVSAANDNPELMAPVLDAEALFGGLGFRYRELDRRLNPSSGIELSIDLQTGIKNIQDARAEADSIENRLLQRIMKGYVQYYFNLFRRQVLTPSLHGYVMLSPQYTVSDLKRFGGARSLRGYREDQFRASQLLWGDLEYRYLLDRRSHAFLFGAMGVYQRPKLVVESNSSLETTSWLHSYGLGFSYSTRLGMLKFSYAISPQDDITNGKVHFGISSNL